jgi:hypothetical protein
MHEWRRRGADSESSSRLNLIDTDLGGQSREGVLMPRLEILALL